MKNGRKRQPRFNVDENAEQEVQRKQAHKKFHLKDLREVIPLTERQKTFFRYYDSNLPVLAVIGSAGTGKTFIALYLALREILSQSQYKRIIVIRSCVPSREMGFLPGTIEEKEMMYEQPYDALCQELFPYANSYSNLKALHHIEFCSTSYLRGLTFDNSIIVVDESQNMNFEELNTVITRLGKHSKLIFCGDTAQNDLVRHKYDRSGFEDFLRILKEMKDAAIVEFTDDDIVRSDIIRQYLIAKAAVHGR